MSLFRKSKLSYDSASDADLVNAVRRGDKKAFVEIVTRHQGMVCGVALGILGDFSASEDAGQDAFLTAWKKLDQLDSPERLRAWLAQIARTTALGHLRRREGFESLDETLEIPDPARPPSDTAATNEESELARQALATLPENYRTPLILYYREGQSVSAVAEMLGLQEDAVKQRLSRGREMLRDRLAGIVETTLRKSKPKTAFTTRVTVALGALTAPAAAAARAGSISAKVFPIMNTSKTLVVTSALTAAICLPVGYHAMGPETGQTEQATGREFAPDNDGPKNGPAVETALLAEWRQLHDVHGRDAQAMPALYAAVAGQKDAFRRRAFRAALISEWAQVDPSSAFRFFSEKDRDNAQRQQFIREWLALNPGEATEALLGAGDEWQDSIRALLVDIARTSPTTIPKLVSKLPRASSHWDTSVRDAFAIIAESDLETARAAAEKITGPNREQALSGVASHWAYRDFEATIKWARGLPQGPEVDEILRQSLIGRAAVDPVSALDNISLVPAGGRDLHFASTTGARVLTEAAKADFDKTIAWISQHPGRLNRGDLTGIAGAISQRLNADPHAFLDARAEEGSLNALIPAIKSALINESSGQLETVWGWLRGQDAEASRELRQTLLESAAWQDPDLALRMIEDIPRGTAGEEEISQLAERLFDGGSNLHRFDALLQKAPDRLKGPLVEKAFQVLRAENFGDPRLWIDRLNQLPAPGQDGGAQAIARAWAEKNPEAALAWVSTLSGNLHDNALRSATGSFARLDAYSAAEWAGSLSAGPDRDTASSSLVFAISENHPHEAWAWAMNIGNPSERQRAAEHAANMLAGRDPAGALQLVNASPLSEEFKAKFRATLASANSNHPIQ